MAALPRKNWVGRPDRGRDELVLGQTVEAEAHHAEHGLDFVVDLDLEVQERDELCGGHRPADLELGVEQSEVEVAARGHLGSELLHADQVVVDDVDDDVETIDGSDHAETRLPCDERRRALEVVSPADGAPAEGQPKLVVRDLAEVPHAAVELSDELGACEG